MKDKDLKEIKGLISVGKERGYVTYEEMNNVIHHLVSSDQLDDVMIMFNKMDIEVVNQSGRLGRRATCRAPLQKKGNTGRSSDPVRVYLRRWGPSASLARGRDRDREAHRKGENIVNGAVLTSSVTVRILKRLIDAEEERCEKAVQEVSAPPGQEFRGQELNGVLEDITELVAKRDEDLRS